ncbi:hypothetical protein ABEB36_010097 [Hypothenemus hampei]|uniref:Uncharacterized protein n=1 Tax=Hypothenemus hampei TaxID=57062 RepID=A0ABD1EII6_HYPHA
MFSIKEKLIKNRKSFKMEELLLPNAKLKFCVDQLQNLNFIFNKRLERNETPETFSAEQTVILAKSVTERLVQRLLCGAAQIDSRFSSKFLINNRSEQNDGIATHLEYIVRLDALSTPLIYATDSTPSYEVLETDKDCPVGYARIRLNSSTCQLFEEFINSFGFLRRDKIQARLVELLAQAASADHPKSPLQVDESSMCGVPGKIINPTTLHHILKLSTEKHVYYGPGGNVPRFPDTRDFRLAIVDEPNGIKLKVEFLSPALAKVTVKVTILIAIGIDSWPATSDFPARVSLGHSDCLLHYQIAQTGMYLVGYGVHSSAWQVRLPAAEFMLLNHYSTTSTVRTILDILYSILMDINNYRKYQKPMSYKILNRYMLFTLLMEELEETSTTPFNDMVGWSPTYLSTLVLKLLDKAIIRLTSEFQPNYFFKKANLLINPGHLCDDDFIIEANNIKSYMVRLFDESLMSNRGNTDFSTMLISQESELTLLYKWQNLVESALPPVTTRGRRLCFHTKNRLDIAHTQYTTRQLEYIGMVLHAMLKVRQLVLQPRYGNEIINDQEIEDGDIHPMEDIIFLIVALMEQATDQYFATSNPTIVKNKLKIRTSYNDSISKLIDLLRKDKEIARKTSNELHDDLALVKIILKWLYKAMDQNKKYSTPILRPYLANIFTSSYSVSFHLETIKERDKMDEIEALSSFCRLVNEGCITPAQGLMDAINKNWQWAKEMMNIVENNTLRLVFVQERGKVYRHILSLPSYDRNCELEGSKTWSDKSKNVKSIQRRTTLPGRGYFNSLICQDTMMSSSTDVPQHDVLKINSPLTLLLKNKHHFGQHRCAGDLLKSMTSMQKISIFQEAASSLPKEDQSKLLSIIDNIHAAKAKRSLTKKWSSTLPQSTKGHLEEYVQRYTPKEESAGIRISPEETRKSKKRTVLRSGSLLGTTRAARLREDSNVFLLRDNFRSKCTVSNPDSAK